MRINLKQQLNKVISILDCMTSISMHTSVTSNKYFMKMASTIKLNNGSVEKSHLTRCFTLIAFKNECIINHEIPVDKCQSACSVRNG